VNFASQISGTQLRFATLPEDPCQSRFSVCNELIAHSVVSRKPVFHAASSTKGAALSVTYSG